MSMSDAIKALLIKGGLTDEQIATVAAVEPPPESEKTADPASSENGLTAVQLAALASGKPDSGAPAQPADISSVKTPTVEMMAVELEALKVRFDRLVKENFNPDFRY